MGDMEPARLRISDADRNKIVEVLRDAAGEGRLDMEELDERIEATFAAKTYADLVPITADLPVKGVTAQPSEAAAKMPRPVADGVVLPSPTSSISMMSGVSRRGQWQVEKTHTAFTMMGGIDIDLREARFASPEVVITANAIMGGIDIVVNAWTRVTVEGFGLMGGFEQGRDKVDAELRADSPHVRVKGVALMGAVTITRKPMPGERKRRKMLGH